jgi:hypothetical protein
MMALELGLHGKKAMLRMFCTPMSPPRRIAVNHGGSLWSRLILHFWSLAVEKAKFDGDHEPDPVAYLQTAFDKTKKATSEPNQWHGTTTACAALLSADDKNPAHPIVYITQLGDSQILVLRPSTKNVLFKTTEQWHWFDCPRQLGTNSPDTPEKDAIMDRVEVEEDDVVIAMSDGVVDNLWEHEIVESVIDSLKNWKSKSMEDKFKEPAEQGYADKMRFVAQELVKAAKAIAEDPFAESPYMEKAIDEGLSVEGGAYQAVSDELGGCLRDNRQARRHQRSRGTVQAAEDVSTT